MDKIRTYKSGKGWKADRNFANCDKAHYYSLITAGMGKTKEEAINSLCDALMTLSEEIDRVVHEVSINSRPDILINYEQASSKSKRRCLNI